MGFCYAKKIFRRLWRRICLGVLLARRRVNPPPPRSNAPPLIRSNASLPATPYTRTPFGAWHPPCFASATSSLRLISPP